MAAEYKLSYTAKEIDTKLTEIGSLKNLVGETPVSEQIDVAIKNMNGTPIEKVLLYYGYPIAINGAWNVDNAVNIYKTYDVVVFGDTYQNPEHTVYSDTVAIISRLAEVAPNVRVVGYVPIGLDKSWADSNLSMDELKNRVNQWHNIGAHGIFLDEFGYDYSVTRERQNEIVNYCHDLGKFVFANSWSIEYCFSPDPMEISWLPDFHPNPNGLAPVLNENDYYLYENLFYTTEKLDDGSFEVECASVWRIDNVLRYYTEPKINGKSYYDVYGTKICSLDGIPSTYSRTQQNIMKSISIVGAAILNITSVAFGDENWGSTGDFEQWDVPELNLSTNGLNGVVVDTKTYTKEDGTESSFPYKWTANINGHTYSITFDIPDPDYLPWVDGMRYASMDDVMIENAWTNVFTFQSDVRMAQESAEMAISAAENAATIAEEIQSEVNEVMPTLTEAEATISALMDEAQTNISALMTEATTKIDDATRQLESGLADLEAVTSGFAFKEVQW